MKNLDMPRIAACFMTFLVVSTLLEQFTPLATGVSLEKTLVSNAAIGVLVTWFLVFMGRLHRDDRRRT